MTNDINTLSHLYEAITSNEERFNNINPALIPIIKKAEQKMAWAIENVRINDVFFAGLLTRMIPNSNIQMVDFKQPTMYTDGKGLFYNPEFVNSIPADAVETVIVHEILHVALGHHLAFADVAKTNSNLWDIVNIACDLAINHLIKDRSGFFKRMLLAGQGEFKDLPTGLDAREYYNLLVKKYQNQPQQQPNKPPQQPQQKQDQEKDKSKEDPDGDSEDKTKGEDGQEQSEDGKPSDESGEGEGEGAGDGQSEGSGEGQGSSGSSEGEGEGEGQGTGGSGSSGKGSSGTPTGAGGTGSQSSQPNAKAPDDIVKRSQELGRFGAPDGVDAQNKVAEQTKHEADIQQQAAQAEKLEQARKEAGKASAGYGKGSNSFVDQNYRELFKQKSNLPWGQILQQFLSNPTKTDRSYSVLNKRFLDYTRRTGMVMPGYKEEKLGDLVFLVDISGSMPKVACNKIFGEITAVTKLGIWGEDSSIRLISFDDGILSEDMFTSDINSKHRSVSNPSKPIDKSHVYRLPLSEKVFSTFKWVVGQGGTKISPALENIRKYISPLPELVIILTDGYFIPNDINYLNSQKLPYKIIWLMTTNVKFPIGKTYNLNDYNYDLTTNRR